MNKSSAVVNGNPNETRKEIAAGMRQVYQLGLTTPSGGNVSMRDDAGTVWITPARLDKAAIEWVDIVGVDLDGQILGGDRRPTSELPLHLEIYRNRPDIRAIVHAHSNGLVACSAARRPFPHRALRQSTIDCGPVGWAEYALPGTQQLAETVAKPFCQGVDCVLMQNHGAIVGGASLAAALHKFESLERSAAVITKAAVIGEIRELKDDDDVARPVIPTEHVQSSSDTCQQDKALRGRLAELVSRACERRLFTSRSGTMAARGSEARFLVAPDAIDRRKISPTDFVAMDDPTCRSSKAVSRWVECFQAIFRLHPPVHCIVHATPVHASAYSVIGQPLPSGTIPESYVVLRQTQICDSLMPIHNPEKIAETISLEQPVLLIENDGLLIVGRSPIDVLDRLEVAEATAASMIACQALGGARLLPNAALDQLREAIPEAYGAVAPEQPQTP